MAAQVGQPCTSAGTLQDLVKPSRRQRLAAPRSFEHDEQPLGRRGWWPLLVNVGTQGAEEARGDWHNPLPTALTLGDEQPPLANVDIGHAEPEYLAPAQPAKQHGLDHRLISPC